MPAVRPLRSLTPTEARVVLSLEEEARTSVDLEGVRQRARVTRTHARKLAHGLVRKGWLQRVRRGLYLLNPGARGPRAEPDADPLRLGSHLAEPYYFGYATAAELWGLFPQVGRTYYVVSPVRVRPPAGLAAEFRVVRCPRPRLFGLRPMEKRSLRIIVSDPERTVLDCLDRPEYSAGIPGAVQVLASAKSHLDWDRLGRYLPRMGNAGLAQRVGYLAERVRPEVAVPETWRRRFLPHGGTAYVPLGPPRIFGRRGPHDRRWRVVRNVPDAQLLGEVTIQ